MGVRPRSRRLLAASAVWLTALLARAQDDDGGGGGDAPTPCASVADFVASSLPAGVSTTLHVAARAWDAGEERVADGAPLEVSGPRLDLDLGPRTIVGLRFPALALGPEAAVADAGGGYTRTVATTNDPVWDSRLTVGLKVADLEELAASNGGSLRIVGKGWLL